MKTFEMCHDLYRKQCLSKMFNQVSCPINLKTEKCVAFFRNRKPRNKNKLADPCKTRANACTAYVSFTSDEQAGRKVFVVRHMMRHSGHDPTNAKERRVSKIDSELELYINMLIDEVNGMQIN